MIVLAISSDSRFVWLLAPARPVGVREDLALDVDEPLVAVDQLRPAELGAQRRELLRVPAVVLIAEGDQIGRRSGISVSARSKLR